MPPLATAMLGAFGEVAAAAVAAAGVVAGYAPVLARPASVAAAGYAVAGDP